MYYDTVLLLHIICMCQQCHVYYICTVYMYTVCGHMTYNNVKICVYMSYYITVHHVVHSQLQKLYGEYTPSISGGIPVQNYTPYI